MLIAGAKYKQRSRLVLIIGCALYEVPWTRTPSSTVESATGNLRV